MALLRCPACDSKGEVISNDPRLRFRCARCGHRFAAGEADSTHEFNIFADDSPLFFPETASAPDALALQPHWRGWVGRFAKHRGLDEGELICRALTAFALQTGFSEPPPGD